MRDVKRQLTRELARDRVFVVLLVVLSAFTSFMYFFVRFSVDGNLRLLEGQAELTKQQALYWNGLVSNGILAGNVLLAFLVLTGFAFVLYFYRFFRANQVELGCLKALGFADRELGRFFVMAGAGMAVCGVVIGLAGGYAASDILMEAAKESYQVDGLVKEVSMGNLLLGCLSVPVTAAAAGWLAYGKIRGKETGILIAGGQERKSRSRMLHMADRAAFRLPERYRLQVRLAFRKPVPVLLVCGSSACFSIMFILAYSLNLSSGVVFESQTAGHRYDYQTTFENPVVGMESSGGEAPYLFASGRILASGMEHEQTVIGMEGNDRLFELLDSHRETLPVPKGNEIVVGESWNELYGVKIGDVIRVSLMVDQKDGWTEDGDAESGRRENGKIVSREMVVSGIAWNAAADTVYIEKQTMETMRALPPGSSNGIWSDTPPVLPDTIEGYSRGEITVQTREEKLDALRRDSVSNRTSAVINQVMGCLIGCILLYLALLLNFQDSGKDIQILRLLGYEPGEIRKMLLDIYRPVLWLSFVLTLWPGILVVKAILKSLSIQIGDYFPFQTNVLVILGIFLLQNVVYQLVLQSFQRGIRKSAPLVETAR